MKETKDVSDEDFSADDPDEVEGASEEDWAPEAGSEVNKIYTIQNFIIAYHER